MQKTVMVCEGCRSSKTRGQYYSLAYKSAESPAGKMEDYCCEGCLIRRLSMILSQIDNAIMAKCEFASVESTVGLQNGMTPKPILITGTG